MINPQKSPNRSFMFKNPFSFNGRIRRLEYGISFLLYFIFINIVNNTLDDETAILDSFIFLILSIPVVWFLWAQGCKRCHDRGKSGWWQIIPFYFIWMLFGDGDRRRNEYGENPKTPVTPDWEWPEDASQQSEVIPIDNVDGDGIIIEKKFPNI